MSTENTPALSVKDQNIMFVLRNAVATAVKKEVEAERDVVFDRLMDLFEQTGTKQISVNLEDGTSIATIAIVQPSEKITTNDNALITYLQDKGLDQYLETIEHPAQEAWTEVKVKPTAVAELTKNMAWISGHPVTEDGEMLDCITRTTPTPTSFRVAYTKAKAGGMDGGERIIREWQDGHLAHLQPGETLPQIEK